MTRSLEATPSDLWCWIWAAVPPTKRQQWLNVPRAALRLGVSESTVRRWLKVGDIPSPAVARRLMQLAILRGRGHLLWPTPDAATIEREQRQSVYASRAARAGLDVEDGPCDLVITHHPRAHAYIVSVLSDGKSLDRIIRAGGVVEHQQTYPDLWTAQTAKFGVLEAVKDHRCILPKAMAPRSHTLAWREAGGVPYSTRGKAVRIERVDQSGTRCAWCSDPLEYDEEAMRHNGHRGHLDCVDLTPEGTI